MVARDKALGDERYQIVFEMKRGMKTQKVLAFLRTAF